MARVFYRSVKSESPTEEDFMSNFAKGLPPRGSEIHDAAVYRSISAYARSDHALTKQRLFPQLGTHIAEFELPDDDAEIAVSRGPTHAEDSHHSLQGDPATFLRRIRSVFPCDQE
jgi:hypothetical protein